MTSKERSESASGEGLVSRATSELDRGADVEKARVEGLSIAGCLEEEPHAPLSGHAVLDAVRDVLKRFIAFPSEEALNAATLWAAHTHVLDAFETTPRLALLSPEPGSGKTRVLEIMELLCARPVSTMNASPAYLFRRIGADPAGSPTVLFDEIDTIFGPRANDKEDLRGLINAGYRRGATVGRCIARGNEITTEEFPAFAAVALAGLRDLPDTIMTRSVVIRMKKRAPGEKVEPFRARLHRPQITPIRDKLSAWMESIQDSLQDANPDLPQGIADRNADVWEPLIAIADAAGGPWPQRVRVAAVTLVTDAQDREPGEGVKLLSDLREIFGDRDAIATDELIDSLLSLEDSPWASPSVGKDFDSRRMARLLKDFEVKPKQLRIAGEIKRGYHREELQDAWERYLPPPPSKDASEKEALGASERGGLASPTTSATSVTSATGRLRIILSDPP